MSTKRGADGFPPNPYPEDSLEWGIEVDRRETINQKRRDKEEFRQYLEYQKKRCEEWDRQIKAIMDHALKRKADEGN